ncbi:MAG TPA: hypothetical protein VNZ22_08300, partial [Bacillota bacterium]|nr:hypothetical protein [Bacillota bacterium]
YRLTIRFYQGAEDQAQSKPTPRAPAGQRGTLLVERSLPGLPDDTAALTLATLRSLSRAPELKMALILPIIAGAALSSTRFTLPREMSAHHLTHFIATLVILVATFSLAPTMANVFGLDRNGFRALVLLPTRRHHILLAKNLAFFPLVGSIAVVLLGIVQCLVRLSWSDFLAGVLQVPLAFLLVSLVCNLVAILTPYRMAPGTLQAKKPKPVVILAVFLTMMGLPIMLAPTLVPPALQALFSWQGWLSWLPVNLLATLLMLLAVGALYWVILPLEGRLLQRREQAILREVTEEVE